MRHLDTFSGIGGWALAARWMGWETVAFVEKEPFCQQVLKKNFPTVEVHDDIFNFSGEPFRGIDILTGSTPCQPFSQAGKRQGSNDERHLFPELLRVVAETRPRWVVIENVYGLLNIESGQVFEAYNTSLESEGYSVQTICVPASALNAPHRRDRLWIVATNPDHAGSRASRSGPNAKRPPLGGERQQPQLESRGYASPHPNGLGERAGHRQVQGTDGEVPERHDDAEFSNAEICVAADTRCEYGQSRGNGGLAANPPEWSHGEFDAERCGDAFTDTINAFGVPRNPKGSGLTSGLDGSGKEQHGRTSPASTRWSEHWPTVAARLCGVSHGLSNWLHIARQGVNDYATSTTITGQDLSRLRDFLQSQEVQRGFRGLDTVCKPNDLLAIVREYEALWQERGCVPMDGEAFTQAYVRGLRHNGETPCPSHRREYYQQFFRQHSDALCELSSEIALAAESILWQIEAENLRDNRVNRLKALGNAIVPQIAYEIFKAIEAHEHQN